MQTTVIGLFDTYRQAAAAVRDLEIAGIMGEEVEVISDTDRDARAQALGVKSPESFHERIARIFGRSDKLDANKVYDTPGDMPNYIGEQEFYATHVRNEGAIIIVRVHNDNLVYLTEAILNKSGSKTRDGKDGVKIYKGDDRPHSPGEGLKT